jgi:signal transduction histidine kinase
MAVLAAVWAAPAVFMAVSALIGLLAPHGAISLTGRTLELISGALTAAWVGGAAVFVWIYRGLIREGRVTALANAALEQGIVKRTGELTFANWQLAAANKELRAFGYSVSHDLRAPLRAIAGFSRVLAGEESGRLGESGRDALARIDAAAGRMAQMIDGLLAISRLTREELRREPVDLSAIAEQVIDDLRSREPRTVDVFIEPGLRATADPRLVHTIFENLLANAWKFTRTRSAPAIRVAGEAGPASAIAVSDNGVGFDMTHADRLFAAFHRLHPASEFEGNGIGLATVRRAVERHGGRIWAEAAPGQGATFRFTLPVTLP